MLNDRLRALHMKYRKKYGDSIRNIEYQVKLQIVSLSLQIAVFGEIPVSPFLQIGIKVFANLVSWILQMRV